MPTYEYGCAACGRVVEVMHGVHGQGPDRCEHCGGDMRKLVSAPAIHFKGSGWAKKDDRDARHAASKKAGAATEKAAGAREGTTGTSTAEAAPAPAPPASSGEPG